MKKNFLRKALSITLAAAFVATSIPGTALISNAAVNKITPPTPVYQYDFEDKLTESQGSIEAEPKALAMGEYNGEISYDTGRDGEGKSVNLGGQYGLDLNLNNVGTEYTISLWMKPVANVANNGAVLFMGYNNPENWIGLAGTGSALKLWSKYDNGYHTPISGVAYTQNEWQQYILSVDNGTATLYKDGAAVGTGEVSPTACAETNTNNDIYLGVTFWGDALFNGSIDEVKVYNQAVSAAEAKYLYDNAASIAISGDVSSAVVGDTAELNADFISTNEVAVKWSSSNEEVATVADNGTVTYVGEGTASIKAALMDGETEIASDSVDVRVDAAASELGNFYPNAIANFTFDDVDTGFSSEGAKAVSGSADIALADLLAQDDEKGSVLQLEKANKNEFLNVVAKDDSSLLTGVTDMKISFDYKTDGTGSNWPFFAAPNTNEQKYASEHYVGLVVDANITAQRYNGTLNGVPRQPSVGGTIAANVWTHVDLVLSETSIILYLDGVKVGAESNPFALTDILGEESVIQIGKANWGSGEYTNGYMDNFSISVRTDLTALKAAVANAETKVQDDYTAESWAAFAEKLDVAKAVIAKAGATQAEANTAEAELTEAQGNLKEKPVLESIKVTPPAKTVYEFGEDLATEGMVVTAVYSDKSEIEVAIGDYSIAGYDSNTPGVQTITVAYEGKEATFTVTVNKKSAEVETKEFVGKYFVETGAGDSLKRLCIDDNSKEVDMQTLAWPGETTDNYRWTLIRTDEKGLYQLQNKNSGLFLAISEEGKAVQKAEADAQNFILEKEETADSYKIKNADGKYLALGDAAYGSGAFVVAADNAESADVWTLVFAEADKSALQAVVNNAKTEEHKYTEDSWAEYQVALTAAQRILDKTDATQQEVDEAKDALEAAEAALKEKAESEIPEVLADFNFDAEPAEGEAFDGGNAKASGTYTLVDHGTGKALKLDGTSQFLNVTAKDDTSLLTGVKEMTVSFQINPGQSRTNWGFFAAPNANQQLYRSEKYLGIFDDNGKIAAQRFNSNAQDRPDSPEYAAGENKWSYITVVYAEDETILYVNGVEAGREASSVSIPELLGDNSILYIGKSTWTSGEYMTGLIDNYKIVSRVMTAEEIAAEALKYVEKDALKAAIDKEVGKEADYTPSSWKAYEDALADAKEVYDNKEVTQAEADAAEAALTKAQNALTKKADKTALNAAIEAAVSLDDKDKYEAESWAAYEKAFTEAKAVSADEEATQQEVEDVVTALTEAQSKLKVTVDKTALQEAINNAKTDAGKYTEDSWTPYQAALTKAQDILDRADATQQEVDEAKDALEAAEAALEPIDIREYATASANIAHSEWGQPASNLKDNDLNTMWNGYVSDGITEGQWIMYDFGDKTVEISTCAINWYDDTTGVLTPKAVKIEYMNAEGEWTEVTPAGNEWTYNSKTATDAADIYGFETIQTSKIRVTTTPGELADGTMLGAAAFEWYLYKELVVQTNKDDLKAAIDGAIAESEKENYTSFSWGVYQTALTAARVVYANEKATQANVDEALANLTEATSSLVPKPVETRKLVASYDMTATDGKLVDKSGNSNDAEYVGFTEADFQTEGEGDDADAVLVFDGGTKYVELPAGLIETESFAIEATFKTSTVANSWLWCLGTVDNANYVFVSPRFDGDVIRAGIKTTAGNERLFDGAGTIGTDDYVTVRMEYDKGEMKLLVNGEEKSTFTTAHSVQDILKNGTADGICGYIGKSLYAADPYFTGTLTEFKVYAEEAAEAEVSKTALQEAINNAETNEEKYTADSWASYQEVLAAAQAVLVDENATQDAVDKAVTDLAAAKDALVEKGDVPTPEIPEGWTLLADFSFDEEPTEGEGFTGGEAEAKGTYTLVDHEGNGKALKLNGTDQFLTVTKEDGSSLLTGMDEVEVSFQMNPSTSATNWGFFAAPNTNEQKYQQEHYIGVVNISGTVNAERYNNSGARPAVAYYETGENAWMDVKVSYLKDKTVLYINGEQVAEAASGYSLADILGENSVLYIGYSTWKTGEYATAEIDNYRIIGRTFTEEEIKADLKAAIDKEVGKEADYTPSSWKNYEDALADAQAVYDDENATRAEVNAAEAALTKAQNALTKKADKTALDAAIKAAVSLDDKDKYEATSWAAYEKALAEAKEVYADEEATQTKVNSATKALTDAQNALKEIEEPNPVVIESITVTAPMKTEYTAGEELDLDGMKITAKYSDGTTKDIAVTDCEVSGYDKAKTGEQTVTVTYEGKTATFKVTVKEAEKPNETDKTALEAAVKAAVPDTEKGKYTEESWAAYEEALNQAKEVLADTDATQKEIDDAAAALDKAAEALESKGLPYVDVVKDDWFYNAAYYNYFAGTMTGTDPTHFSPYATLVRAQFATILYRLNGEPKVEYETRFPDVPDGQFYSKAVIWAAEAEVVTGYTDSGYFGTNDPITREQMVTMMYRYADHMGYESEEPADISKYTDADKVTEFAEAAMKWAVGNGIIEGKENTDGSYRLDPQGNTSRAECSIIIQRFMETFGE